MVESATNKITRIECLLPRKGRGKVDMDGEDAGKGIAGNAGTYGCLAIDNLYNVMHLSDRTSPLSGARIA